MDKKENYIFIFVPLKLIGKYYQKFMTEQRRTKRKNIIKNPIVLGFGFIVLCRFEISTLYTIIKFIKLIFILLENRSP